MKHNKMKGSFSKAIKNIIHYGDTDIFPFPFERYFFQDKEDEVVKILSEIHKNFETSLSINPPLTIEKQNQVGYFGFRRATLIEPFWNAYFLGTVISIAEKIEEARIPLEEEVVYSYRYDWNSEDSSLFQKSNWIDYKKKCVENSKEFEFVLQTDISDFYHRVNHHKLENELKRLDDGSNIYKNIISLLSKFTETISYGLPVGGPAARILSELSLNHVDRHLSSLGIKFCRYADDFTIFCSSKSECYKALISLSEKIANDQLSLNKGKTKIMSASEFRDIHKFLDPVETKEILSEEQKLLNISIEFDPYSDTAHEDYENLKEAVSEIDIIGLLSKEVGKTKIDQTITKQAINTLKALDFNTRFQAVLILLNQDNLNTLSPVFTTILRVIRSIYHDFDSVRQNAIDTMLLRLFKDDNYLIKIQMNLNFIIQVLAIEHSQEKENLFVDLYSKSSDHLSKRQIIIAMTNWECHYWLTDIKKHFNTMTTWERRAFIYGSYYLGDEGRHWREHNNDKFTTEESLIKGWCADRIQTNKKILV